MVPRGKISWRDLNLLNLKGKTSSPLPGTLGGNSRLGPWRPTEAPLNWASAYLLRGYCWGADVPRRRSCPSPSRREAFHELSGTVRSRLDWRLLPFDPTGVALIFRSDVGEYLPDLIIGQLCAKGRGHRLIRNLSFDQPAKLPCPPNTSPSAAAPMNQILAR